MLDDKHAYRPAAGLDREKLAARLVAYLGGDSGMDSVCRVSTAEWTEILMNYLDTIIYRGEVRKIKVKQDLGFGVLEIWKAPKS